jgi:predicted amidohydrolase YtcJ
MITVVDRAQVRTLDPDRPMTDVLAFHKGVIVDPPAPSPGSVTVIDARGRAVLPGFTDSHIHFAAYSRSLDRFHIGGVKDLAEALAVVKARTGTPGAWILGRGFVINGFSGLRFPTREHLDSAAPENPVVVSSFDGHVLWVNSLALAAAGIDRRTPDPEGGKIERDDQGEPTGILLENAVKLLRDVIPVPEDLTPFLTRGLAELHALGITAIHNFERASAFRGLGRLRAQGKLTLRVTHAIDAEELPLARALGIEGGLGDEFLQLLGVKAYADGALNVRTAWMLAPYGPEATRGMRVIEPDALRSLHEQAGALRMPLAVHAIGDAAVKMVVDVFSRPSESPFPSRVEHAQHLDPADIPRLAASGAAASMQPVHLFYDMDPIEEHLADRRGNAYMFRSLFRAGVPLVFGSDAPIAPPNPFLGLHAAVRRQKQDTAGDGWTMEEALTLEEALGCYTRNPARITGQGDWRGTLVPGKKADFVILDRPWDDLLEGDLHDIRVDMTFVNGECVYDRPGA